MCRINKTPGEAAKAKGRACYPEDFSRLGHGEDFTAWRAGEDLEIETILEGGALLERIKEFEKQEESK